MEIEELLDALDTLYSLSRGVSNGMSTAISLIFVIVPSFCKVFSFIIDSGIDLPNLESISMGDDAFRDSVTTIIQSNKCGDNLIQ